VVNVAIQVDGKVRRLPGAAAAHRVR